MGGRLYEIYTWLLLLIQLVSLNSFNWYQFWHFWYTHIFVYVCMLHFQWYQFLLVSNFHTYMFYLCSKISQILVFVYSSFSITQHLELQLYFNWFSFQLISYFKPMHVFCWYFIKGEKIRFSFFNWYLYFHSLTLW